MMTARVHATTVTREQCDAVRDAAIQCVQATSIYIDMIFAEDIRRWRADELATEKMAMIKACDAFIAAWNDKVRDHFYTSQLSKELDGGRLTVCELARDNCFATYIALNILSRGIDDITEATRAFRNFPQPPRKATDSEIQREWLAAISALPGLNSSSTSEVEHSAVNQTLSSTTPDEARAILLGLATRDPSVEMLSLRESAALVEKTNGKKCSTHAIRKARELLNWKSFKPVARTKRLRTVSLGKPEAGRNHEKSTSDVIEAMTEDVATQKIKSMPIPVDTKDKILEALRDERITPTKAVDIAIEAEERSRARTN